MNEEEFQRLNKAYRLKADIASYRTRISVLKSMLDNSQLLSCDINGEHIDQDLLIDAVQKQISRHQQKIEKLELNFKQL